MQHVTSRTRTGAIVAAVGGVAAAIGVFMPWASIRFVGDDFLGAFEDSLVGTSDFTGILALIGALVVLAGAVIVLMAGGGGMRRMAAMAAGIGGVAIVVLAVLGFFRVDDAITEATGGIDLGLTLEQLGIEAGRGLGVFVTAIGGLVAAVGGFMAAGSAAEGAAPEAPAEPPPPSG